MLFDVFEGLLEGAAIESATTFGAWCDGTVRRDEARGYGNGEAIHV